MADTEPTTVEEVQVSNRVLLSVIEYRDFYLAVRQNVSLLSNPQ